MEREARACAPEVFRTVYRLCQRLTRKTPFAPYLCAVHAADGAAEKLERMLHGGEVLCQVRPGLVYVLLFAHDEGEALGVERQIRGALPGAAVRLQCVRAGRRDEPDPLA